MSKTREERRARRLRIARVIVCIVLLIYLLAILIGTKAESEDIHRSEEVVDNQIEDVNYIIEEENDRVEEPDDVIELIYLGQFKTTAYCKCIRCCGIWSSEHPSRGSDYVQKTASGTVPEAGRTIAADWSVLPKGTQVVINGNTYTVEDTGSGVDGKHIDVFFDSHEEARAWGVQYCEVEMIYERRNDYDVAERENY